MRSQRPTRDLILSCTNWPGTR
jgi:hypothetical protein